MGLVRCVLAYLVLYGHAGGKIANIGAIACVQVFYIISGCYMAAVYETKYSKLKSGQILFYLNRIFRLWPTYIILLFLTLASFYLFESNVGDTSHIFDLFINFGQNIFHTVILCVVSIFIIGQDVLSVNESLHFMLPVRQSWTLATELLFYLLVPFVFKKRNVYLYGFPIFVVCMTVKFFVLKKYGWRYSYFFPIWNLGYFFLGITIYRISMLKRIRQLKESFSPTGYLCIILLLCSFFVFKDVGFEQNVTGHLVFISIVAALIPFVFSSKIYKLDQHLGNLSYGIYLDHFLFIALLESVMFRELYGVQASTIKLLIITLLSVSLSIVIEKIVQTPVDNYRRRLVLKGVK